jgi:hypothetical protein
MHFFLTLLFIVVEKKNENNDKTNYDKPKFQPQIKLVSLRSLFPSVEFKLGTQYNLSGKISRLNS